MSVKPSFPPSAAADSQRCSAHFVYLVCHDLQSPLRAVSGLLELVAQRNASTLDPNSLKMIQRATEATDLMKEQVEALLTLTRLEHAHRETRPVALTDAVARGQAHHYGEIQTTGARFAHDPLPTVRGVSEQLGLLWEHLIGNSLKFARPNTPPEIAIHCEEAPSHWTIRVSDNGIGIPSEFSGRIFEVFQRLHAPERYPGIGIGLTLACRIMQLHGGSIELASDPSDLGGAQFILTFPKLAGPPSESALPRP